MICCAAPTPGTAVTERLEGMPGFLTTQVNVFNFTISSAYLLCARRGD
uniref:Uncharacterized protein n=1 Tax=mine drainage metagenome TaxID=410659 RepID=E6QDJ7_9ZZZZ